ncbi:MAG: adenylate/guanylate cyclase domain-containing protein [Lentisphaeria bacterium]|nr:adenylate/guanylate cyclase domain-containing protein [Lentisphaeria bacterium]
MKERLRVALKWMLRFDGFHAGCVASAAMALLFMFPPNLVEKLRQSFNVRMVDWMFNLRGPQAPGDDVVIIEIDEKSLGELGQWPWPRTMMGNMLKRVTADGALVIGLDIVFAEPDRLSPKRVAESMRRQLGIEIKLPDDVPDTDVLFGEALENLPVVLGYNFILGDDSSELGEDVPYASCIIEHQAGFGPENPSFDYDKAALPVLNRPEISEYATSEGFFNANPDPDSVIRRIPMFIVYGPMKYPSLAMEMLREGLGLDTYSLEASIMSKPGVWLGTSENRRQHFVPSDDRACAILNWRGKTGSFSYVSASDVLAGRVPKGTFQDKYVLVGATASGLRDLRACPLDESIPGVEVHATLIDNVLHNRVFTHDKLKERGLLAVAILVGGIALSAVIAYAHPFIGALFGVLSIVGSVFGNYYFFFLQDEVVGLTGSLVTIVVILVVVNTVNYFTEGRQKAFIRGAFSKYVSADVVAEMVRDPEKLSLAGQEREVTIMFSDIRGFTGISELFTAVELAAFLNEYLTEMTDIVLDLGGTVDKFIGDAVMAFWGAPLDNPEHARFGIDCALRMQERLVELRADWEARGLPPIRIGVGLNTGLVSVGNMGSRDRFDYTVMGDNVNLSSRLEGLTKQYGVGNLISESTRESARWETRSRFVDRVRVKGRQEPVRIYEALAEPLAEADQLLWDEAMETYSKQQFDRAEELIRQANEASPHLLYDMYLERIEHHREEPPGEDWDGVYTHKTK